MKKKDQERLITALADLTRYPLNQDEQGGCVYCGGCKGFYSDETEEAHQRDCEWIVGRTLLLELEPEIFEA